MAFRHYMDRSTLIFLAVTAFSWTTRLISTAIVTRLATTLTAATRLPLAVTASVFELFALFTLITAVGLYLRRLPRSLIMTAWFLGAALCIIATLLSMTSLGLTLSNAKHNLLRASAQGEAHDLAMVGLTISVLGLIPQITFYVLIWPKQARSCTEGAPPNYPSSGHSEKQSIAVHLASLSPARANPFKSTSESRSISTSDERSRYAVRQPMSSKTRLLLGASFASRDSRSIHSRAESMTMSEPARINSDFEGWDTSAVEAFEQPFVQKTVLAPIPGSRPASPANPLDGPFGFEQVGPEGTPLPESPLRSPTSECGASLRNFRRPSEYEDLYYHPLFRSESPAPPLASPGTVITASPFAGQIVSSELVAPRILHSAASSRPASPSLMSPIRSHAGSLRSLRTLPTSPVEHVGATFESEHRGPSQISGHLPP